MPVVSYDKAHTSFVSFVGFLNSDDNAFVSASFDGSLILWDRRKSNPAQGDNLSNFAFLPFRLNES